MKKNITQQQSNAQAAVIKVRREMSDLHQHYQKELQMEKKDQERELQYMQRQKYDDFYSNYTA